MKKSQCCKGFRKSIVLVLVMALLAGALSGCNALTWLQAVVSGEEVFAVELPEVETRPEEEILSSGAEANDVLALLDSLCLSWFRNSMEGEDQMDTDKLNAQFTSITVPQRSESSPIDHSLLVYSDPGFIKNRWFYPVCSWHQDSLVDENLRLGNVYSIDIHYVEEYDGVGMNACLSGWGVGESVFENVMALYGVSSYILSEEHCTGITVYNEKGEEVTENVNPIIYYTNWGQTTYEPMTIDRETVANATEEQLAALYEMVRSIYQVNLEGILPEGTGNVIEEEDSTKEERTVMEYTCYGVPVSLTQYDANGELMYKRTFVYDENKKLILHTLYDAEGTAFETVKTEFDENGFLIRSSIDSVREEPIPHRNVEYFEFDRLDPNDYRELTTYDTYTQEYQIYPFYGFDLPYTRNFSEEYDMAGNLISEGYTAEDGEHLVCYIYDEAGELLYYVEYILYPDGSQSETFYNPDGSVREGP